MAAAGASWPQNGRTPETPILKPSVGAVAALLATEESEQVWVMGRWWYWSLESVWVNPGLKGALNQQTRNESSFRCAFQGQSLMVKIFITRTCIAVMRLSLCDGYAPSVGELPCVGISHKMAEEQVVQFEPNGTGARTGRPSTPRLPQQGGLRHFSKILCRH